MFKNLMTLTLYLVDAMSNRGNIAYLAQIVLSSSMRYLHRKLLEAHDSPGTVEALL